MESRDPPFLSVIMPVLNGARTLARTLDSLLSQSDGIELIAVIQASADGSREIIESYANRLRMVLIDAPDSKNWMQNSNIGLAAAQGPLCCFLHQDDIWREGRVAALRNLVHAHPKAGLWIHDADFIDDQDHVVGRFGPPFGAPERIIEHDQFVATLMTQNTLSLPAVMFARDLAREVGGLDETLWYSADWDFWLKLAARGDVVWSPRRLAGFRIHANSLTITGSRNTGDFRQQMEIVFNRHSGSLRGKDAKRIKKLARIAIDLNVCLAAAFHRQHGGGYAAALTKLLSLGPFGIVRFARYSQINQRVLSRLRASWSG